MADVPQIGASQTSVIFGALLASFIVFITVRGELSQYLRLFTVTKPASSSPPTAQTPQPQQQSNNNDASSGPLGSLFGNNSSFNPLSDLGSLFGSNTTGFDSSAGIGAGLSDISTSFG